MGEARSAQQTSSVVAQSGRICRCVVVATETMGGRDVSRFTLWRADVAEKSVFHAGGDTLLSDRDRREHGALQRRQRRPLASVAVSGRGTTGASRRVVRGGGVCGAQADAARI